MAVFDRGSRATRALALSALMVTVATPARAGDTPRYEPAPDWADVQATLPTVADEAGLVLFDRAFKLEDGELWSFTDLAVKVTSPEMLSQVGTLSVAWQPEHGDAVIHRLDILRDGRTIDGLAGGERFEVIRREQGLERLTIDGRLTATHQVQGLRVGDTLRFSSSTVERDPVLGGNAQMIAGLVTQPVVIGGGAVRVVWPTDSRVRTQVSGLAQPPQPATAGRYRTLTVAQPLPKLPDAPAGLPARLQPIALVEASTFADWAEVSTLGSRLFAHAGLIADGSELAAKADAIAAQSADPTTRAAGALRLVQDDIRYLFNGLDGGNYRPQSVADTWTRRYGDCKAKTLLLLALLDRLGIPAEAAFVNTGQADATRNRLPSFAAFDHVIVRAQLDGRTAWLDGTKVGDRADDLFAAPPFRVALPALASGGDLTDIAMGAPGRPDQTVRIDTDASAGLSLPATFQLTVTSHDAFAQQLKAAASAMGRAEADELVDGYVRSFVDDAIITTRDWRFDEDGGELRVEASGIRSLDWDTDGGTRALPLATVVDSVSLDATRYGEPWGDAPVAVGDVSHLDQVDIVRLPELGQPFELEGERRFDTTVGGLALSRDLALDDGVVTFREGRRRAGWEIAAADLPAQREAQARLSAEPPRLVAPAAVPLRWEEVRRARASGALAPMLAAHAAQVARAKPDDPDALLARAMFYESIFDPRSAAADLTAALAIQPDETKLAERGGILSAVDPAAARADLTEALKLDPTNERAIQWLFELEMAAGNRAAADAVTERAAGAGVAAETIALLRAEGLAARGRAAEGLTVLTAATNKKANTPDVLNERCWFRARFELELPQALKDCTKAIQLGSEPASYLDSRALVYMRMGDTQAALADLDAALEIAPDMAEALYKRGLVRTELGRPDGREDIAAATGMDPTLAARNARWGIKP